MRDASSLVRPMSNLTISYCALNSMILSKIADRWPESIRCPSASIVSLAAMERHCSGGALRAGDTGSVRFVLKGGRGQKSSRAPRDSRGDRRRPRDRGVVAHRSAAAAEGERGGRHDRLNACQGHYTAGEDA